MGASTSAECIECEAFLKQGPELDSSEFLQWAEEHKDGEWIKATNDNGYTPLHLSLLHNAPEAVVDVLASTWQGALKEKTEDDCTPLHIALMSADHTQSVTLLNTRDSQTP